MSKRIQMFREWLNGYNPFYLRAAIREVEARNARLIAGDFSVDQMHYENGRMKISFATRMMESFAEAGMELLDRAAGVRANNYLELHLWHQRSRSTYTLTFQRPTGKTPDQMKREAEARVAELEDVIATLTAGACAGVLGAPQRPELAA